MTKIFCVSLLLLTCSKLPVTPSIEQLLQGKWSGGKDSSYVTIDTNRSLICTVTTIAHRSYNLTIDTSFYLNNCSYTVIFKSCYDTISHISYTSMGPSSPCFPPITYSWEIKGNQLLACREKSATDSNITVCTVYTFILNQDSLKLYDQNDTFLFKKDP